MATNKLRWYRSRIFQIIGWTCSVVLVVGVATLCFTMERRTYPPSPAQQELTVTVTSIGPVEAGNVRTVGYRLPDGSTDSARLGKLATDRIGDGQQVTAYQLPNGQTQLSYPFLGTETRAHTLWSGACALLMFIGFVGLAFGGFYLLTA
ncbi:MAG TPA: hypothetical protein VLF67_03145 [Candidatus Saccharimonas sp.]|nr:hypothetical protein [Candidatus Saccharimonas sp.]